MKILLPEDILTFGKNKGLELKVVYKYQPSYIEWAIENVDDFKIDVKAFQKLPKPTPFSYNKYAFSCENIKKKNEDLTMEDWTELLISSDSVNQLKTTNVFTIKELIKNENNLCQEIDYKFPQRIIKLNENK